MRVIDAYVLAAEAYEMWCKRYGDMMLETPVLVPWLVPKSDKAVIAQKLKALGLCPTPKQVNEMIGNESWTTVPDCFHCRLSKDKVVELEYKPMIEDEDEDEDAADPIYLCSECLLRAFMLIEES